MITGTSVRWRRLWHTSVPAGPRGMRSNQVHPVAVEHLQRVRAGRADSNPETRFAQQVGKGVAERLLILDQGHTCHVAASRGGSCSTGPARCQAVSAAGVMLASPAGSLALVASSSEAMRLR